MKKTFKFLAIFMVSLIVILVGSISIYTLINNNKTYYIYDLRIVEPVAGEKGYVYTDDTKSYVSVKNQKVYMHSNSDNLKEIGVFASSSTNTTKVSITSSDTNVAKIVFENNKCYVNYVREGVATITTELGGMKDSFDIYVYDEIADEFRVYDNKYYGEYSTLFPNVLVGYADGNTYGYDYELSVDSGNFDTDMIDNDLIRIDETKIDTDVFESVTIDTQNHKLLVKCKKPTTNQTENLDNMIYVQTYYISNDGEVMVKENYTIRIKVVTYIPEFLQILVSSDPDFVEGYVYTNTSSVDISAYSTEEIAANPDLIEDYLEAQKAEKYLAENGEKATYCSYFSNRVSELYIKIRKVYTNGDVVYLKDGENATFTFNGTYCKLSPTGDYYKLTLKGGVGEYFYNHTEYNFSVNLSSYDIDFGYTFSFKYIPLIEENISYYYDYDEETGIYTYKYWDIRTKYYDQIYDNKGNVVGFGF